jgi:hypothetical protein
LSEGECRRRKVLEQTRQHALNAATLEQPYVPGEDRDPSCIARLSREIEALKAERDGLRERVAELERERQ